MQKADKDTIKHNNKLVILSHLKTRDLSRTDLAEITGLSNSTVSALVSELSENNILFEKSIAESSGGRKPIILSINPNYAYTMLLIIVQNKIITALVDLKFEVVYHNTFDYSICTEESISAAILESIDKTLADNRSAAENIVGVGVSIPGLVDHSTNTVIFSTLLQLKDFNIKDLIKTRLNKNVYAFKDTDALMLGEYLLNDLSRYESYLYVLVDSGVGLSFMNKGEIMQLNRCGFQLGHIQLDENGPQCNCGKSGCVEAFVSEQATKRDLKETLAKAGLPYDVSIDSLTLADIVTKANEGDVHCEDVLARQCAYIGRVVALTINIFAPNLVLIGGPLSSAKFDKDKIVRNSVEKSVLNIFSNTNIKFTTTGNKACFIGMADKVFNKEIFSVFQFSHERRQT